MWEIRDGVKRNLDVSIYADPRFHWEQMSEIRKSLKDGLDMGKYVNSKTTILEIKRICYLLKNGKSYELNSVKGDFKMTKKNIERIKQISKEFKEMGFDSEQIHEIELGLENNLDISKYADPNFNGNQMIEIRFGLEQGLNVSKYADSKFTWEQMQEIRLGLKSSIDVSKYADPKFDWKQMAEIRKNLKSKKIVGKNKKE